ncbi:hypothetical protein [Streptomyces sp. S1D4-14]|uniref:hypothetical protein n=1 Tax=Streptomyces sp. S1D4-14 TaxID=2594461 RepID=UPI0035C93BDD
MPDQDPSTWQPPAQCYRTVLAIQQSTVPPTANLQDPAPGIDLNLVAKTASRQPVRAALSNSFGFGGHNVVLAFCAA